MPELDPSQFDLSIDLDGNWRHQDEVITHPRILAMLSTGLKKMGSAHVICAEGLCLPVRVADCAYVVLSVRHAATGITLLLTDGAYETLDPAALTIDAQNVPRTKVKNGAFEARFSRTAWMQLTDAVTEDGQGGFELTAAGKKTKLQVG